MIIVIGFTGYSVTKLLVQDIGLAGMEQPLNNCVVEDSYIMNNHTLVTGLIMLMDVRNIVSSKELLIKF